MVPVYNCLCKERVFFFFFFFFFFIDVRIALHSFKTFTRSIVCGLAVNDFFSDTVRKFLSFNKPFPLNSSQKGMILHCRHQPLHHLEEEHQSVDLSSHDPGVGLAVA